ncbi:MAG TPA: type VI secretion system contractile sheath large subunit [Planctomycetota bacterium]|nr:type VI secretion system contractile sheath large subunit [Planctomycetota bacterium]
MVTPDGSLDLVVAADLAAGRDTSRRIYPVDPESLEALLESCEPAVDPGGIGAAIPFRSFKDFRPERLATRLPAIAKLRSAREQVLEAAAGRRTAESIRPLLEGLGMGVPGPTPKSPAPPLAGPERPPAAAGGLFDLVDLGEKADAPDPTATGQARRLIDLVVGPATAGTEGLRKTAELLEAAFAPALRSALCDPAFRDLEATWRGLRWLVRTLDFRSGIRLHAAGSTKAALAETVREILLPFALERRSEGRRTCLVLDFAFDPRAPVEADMLGRIARCAAERSVPVVASLEPGAFASGPAGLEDRSNEAWHRLRDDEASRWLALAANRFLLRLPYGRDLDAVRDFAFEETAPGAEPSHLWGRPGWFVAALAASSTVRVGWAVDLSGRKASEALEGLPVREMARPSGERIQSPLEAELGESAAHGWIEAGVLPLAVSPHSDRPFAAGAPSVRRKGAGEAGSSWRQSLFAEQVAGRVQRILDQVDPSRSLEEISRTLVAGLELLGLSPEGAEYTVRGEPTRSPRPAVVLQIRPAGGALRGLEEVQLDVPIPLQGS